MLNKKLLRRFGLVALFTALGLFAISLPVDAQSCSLCYTQAASASAKFIQALRSGILVLIIPPMFMSAGITYLAYKKRNQCKRSDDPGESNQGW